MKNFKLIISTVFGILFLYGCHTNKESENIPMWIFYSNTPEGQIEKGLKEDRIFENKIDTVINGNSINIFSGDKYAFDYCGIDWDRYLITCINDTIREISMTRMQSFHNKKILDEKIENFITDLDSIYGKHRLENIEDGSVPKSPNRYDWEKNNYKINLSISSLFEDNDVIVFSIIGYNENTEKLIKQIKL